MRDRALGDVIEVLIDGEDAYVLENRLAVLAIGAAALCRTFGDLELQHHIDPVAGQNEPGASQYR